ncbi:hypothetical protein QTO34_012499, partial [Cnephaeus nilssonii]
MAQTLSSRRHWRRELSVLLAQSATPATLNPAPCASCWPNRYVAQASHWGRGTEEGDGLFPVPFDHRGPGHGRHEQEGALETLKSYRLCDPSQQKLYGKSPLFGQYLVPENPGTSEWETPCTCWTSNGNPRARES